VTFYLDSRWLSPGHILTSVKTLYYPTDAQIYNSKTQLDLLYNYYIIILIVIII